MPTGTPAIKVDAVRKWGGNVLLHGANYDEAQAEAMRLVEVEGRTLIHPFDDPLVIAGQGTIGMEIVRQMSGKELDAIFVCVGGGGLLAGILAYVKQIRPEVKIYGVEAVDAAGMTESVKAGHVVALDTVGLFADGTSFPPHFFRVVCRVFFVMFARLSDRCGRAGPGRRDVPRD